MKKNKDAPLHPASSIKPLIALLMLKHLQKQNISLDSRIDGLQRSYRDALIKMLVESNEEATEHLIKSLKTQYDLRNLITSLGLKKTSIEPRQSTILELAVVLDQAFIDKLALQKEHTTFYYSLLAEAAKRNTNRISCLFDAMKNQKELEIEIYKKPGTLLEPPLLVDTAVITITSKETKEKRSFIFCIHGTGNVANFFDLEKTTTAITMQFYSDILLQTFV